MMPQKITQLSNKILATIAGFSVTSDINYPYPWLTLDMTICAVFYLWLRKLSANENRGRFKNAYELLNLRALKI